MTARGDVPSVAKTTKRKRQTAEEECSEFALLLVLCIIHNTSMDVFPV